MAIHIDIYAHLRDREVIREGERLRRYINGLEREIEERRVSGVEGATKQIIKLEDAVMSKRDQAINQQDELVKAERRLAQLRSNHVTIADRMVRTVEEQTEKNEELEKSLKAIDAAEQDLATALQRSAHAQREHTRTDYERNEQIKAQRKNLQDVAKITTKNTAAFKRQSLVTNRMRREAESLHGTNLALVQDNKKVTKTMRDLSDATKKTREEEEKYKELRKQDGVTGKQLKAQGKAVLNAKEKERRAAEAANETLVETIQHRRDHIDVVNSNEVAMRRLGNESLQLEKRAERLRDRNEDTIKTNQNLRRLFDRVDYSVLNVTNQFRKLDEMSRDNSVSQDSLANQIERVNDALVTQRRVAKDSEAALEDHYKRVADAEKRAAEAEKKKRDAAEAATRRQATQDLRRIKPQGMGQYAARNLGALTPLGTLSPSTLLPLAGVLGTVGEAVVTASQGLALLPAGVYTATAAIGTLIVGFKGFGDALTNMDDPKKLSEALANLSPNAQQAALSIKNLVDGPLGDLKRATHDALFENVGGTIQMLTQTLGPMIQRMTTSIATSFNQMFTGISLQMATPEMSERFDAITQNIAGFFQRIMPGMSALNSAFLKLAETGASFLPQMATGFSNLMVTFDRFITRAQEDGSLQNFMEKGINAIAAISKWLLGFGQEIYKVFGNKSPEDFIDTLNGVRAVLIGLFELFKAIATGIDKLGPTIKFIVDALGGFENVLYGIIAIGFAAWLVKMVKLLRDLKGIVQVTGGAFGFLGKKAKASAAVTSGAFTEAGGKGAKGFYGTFSKAWRGLGFFGLGLMAANAISEGLKDGSGGWRDALAKGFDPEFLLNPVEWINTLRDSLGKERLVAGPGGAMIPESWARGKEQERRAAEGSSDLGDLGALNQKFDPSLQPFAMPNFDITDTDFTGPGWPLDENNKALTDSEFLDKLRCELPRESYAVDPFTDPITGQKLSPMLPMGPNGMPEYPAGGVPGTPSVKGPTMPQYNEFGQFTGYGANMVDPEEVFDAQLGVMDQARSLEEANKDLLAAKQSGISSAEEINDYERKVLSEKLSLHKALVRLGQAQTGDVKKLKDTTNGISDALGEFGAALDNDFGISKGLSGIAENLTKFLANLAFAPAFGAIRGAQAAMGFPKGEGVGHGLAGIAASNMGYYKGGPLDPNRETGGDGWSPSYRNPATTTGDVPLAAEAGYKPPTSSSGLASALKLNPNNTSTAGLKPHSMALLGLIQGMPQFANIMLGSGKRAHGNAADRLPNGGEIPWHPNGQGLDLSLNANDPVQSAQGDQLKAFLESNKAMFGINHVLWNVKDHFDHLHIGLNGSGNGKPDTSPLLEALGGGGSLAGLVQPGGTASLGGGSIPIPLPVTIVGGAVPGGAPPKPPAPKPPGALRSDEQAKIDSAKSNWSAMSPTARANAVKRGDYQPDGTPIIKPSRPTPPPLGGPFSPPAFPPVDMPDLQRYAKGGEVPIMAHSGEHVLTREDVAAMGGQAAVYNFRRKLQRYEVGGAIEPTDLGGLLGVESSSPTQSGPKPPPAPKVAPLERPPVPDLGLYPEVAAALEPPKAPVPPAVPTVPETASPVGVETPGSVIGAEVEAPAGYGEGFSITGGGLLGIGQDAAMSAAAAGGMMGGGGAGAAAALQTAMKLINRGIEYGGQVAAISAQGMLETFLPAGGSELAQNNWATRWLGGIAGAAPAIANLAGGNQASNQQVLPGVGPTTAEQIAAQNMNSTQDQAAAPGGPYTGVNIENYVVAQSEDRGGQDLARYQPAPGAR